MIRFGVGSDAAAVPELVVERWGEIATGDAVATSAGCCICNGAAAFGNDLIIHFGRSRRRGELPAIIALMNDSGTC